MYQLILAKHNIDLFTLVTEAALPICYFHEIRGHRSSRMRLDLVLVEERNSITVYGNGI